MSNYEIANMIHNVAMEAADFADMARIKGNKSEQLRQLELAYTLDKDAALRLQSEPDDNEWKFIYLSSAGWLAYQLELYGEAMSLVELGLSGKPKGIAIDRLQELKDALIEKIPDVAASSSSVANNQAFYGMLASADLEKEAVKIKENGQQKYRLLHASKELIQQAARYLIGEYVEVNAQTNEQGVLVLRGIKRAA